MNKDNILYGIIGLLIGVIVGYLATGSLNRSTPPPVAANSQQIPADHPAVGGNAETAGGGSGPQAEVAATIEQARREPTNFDVQMKAGDLFYQIKRYDQAIEFYTNAQKVKPREFAVLSQLGNANFDFGRYEEAGRWYEQALQQKPDDVMVRTDLGLTYYFRTPRELDRAIATYRESLRYDPRHEQTLQNLVTALLDKGDQAAAGETLRQLEQVNPNNQAIAQFRSRLGAR
jgi:tetratricopeptide (TPR) repeat protein